MNKVIKHLIVSPITGKRVKSISIGESNALEKFHWNTVYHVYNSTRDYHQLMTEELIDKKVWYPVS